MVLPIIVSLYQELTFKLYSFALTMDKHFVEYILIAVCWLGRVYIITRDMEKMLEAKDFT